MKRDEFIRAGDEPGSQDFDSIQLAALARADIAPRRELFGEAEPVASDEVAGMSDDACRPMSLDGRPQYHQVISSVSVTHVRDRLDASSNTIDVF